MAANLTRAWLLAYDIRDVKRLAKVHRCVRTEALVVQYSVFLGAWSQREAAEVAGKVRALIDGRSDDVRIYCLPERCPAVLRGPGTLRSGYVAVRKGFPLIRMLQDGGPPALAAVQQSGDDL